MEENEIGERLPEIYQYLQSQDVRNWVEIHRDLQLLQWLSPESESEVISNVWEIVDRWGVSLLEESPVLLVTKINRIKLFLVKSIYSVFNSKEKLRSICIDSNNYIKNLLFIKKAKEILSFPQENTEKKIQLIISSFEELKEAYISLFLHVDKYFVTELRYSLKNLLEYQFRNSIVIPLKEQIPGNLNVRQLLIPYDRFYTASYAPSHNYLPQNRETVYLGEIGEGKKRNGYGRLTYSNGDTYEGFWDNDKPHGKGVYIWKNFGHYEGEFVHGNIIGKGKRTYSSNNVYEGEFLNGKKHGVGRMVFKNGDVYEGEWDKDDMHGTGKYIWSSQDFFEGQFSRDRREGKGTLRLSTGEVIEGEWKDGFMIDPAEP